MKKLDQRGTAALEFCLVAVPLFMLMFAIFDLGRYAITVQSLRMVTNAGARAWMIIYANDIVQGNPPQTDCDPLKGLPALTNSAMQAVAPLLYYGGLTPTVGIKQSSDATKCVITASQPGFSMVFSKLWGGKLDAPNTSTSIPF